MTQSADKRSHSITGSASFGLRLLRSEWHRAMLMAGVYTVVWVLAVIRRMDHGVVMSDDRVFFPFEAIFIGGTAFQLAFAWFLKRAIARSGSISRTVLASGAVIELTLPIAAMAVLHYYSQRGAYAELSESVLLLLPITILLSVLRLRPVASLAIGLAAGAAHAGISVLTVIEQDLPASQYPPLLSYGFMLGLTGVAAMLVSRAMRSNVIEAVNESHARELASRQLARIENDLEVARHIQSGLLPSSPPNFDGFDVAGMNRPADQTGGDYYDWQRLPDGRLMVVMADVTGHGIGPALVMAVCRAYARASAPLQPDPALLMSRLNDLMHADLSDGRFVTLAMAAIDGTGGVELVSAGHGPTFLYRADLGQIQPAQGPSAVACEEFWGDGLPLAVVDSENYGPPRTFSMHRGDLLVMLTDGVMEWQNSQGEQFGTERIAQAVSAAAAGTAEQVVQAIDRAVRTFAQGMKQNDDVTIVVVKRTA